MAFVNDTGFPECTAIQIRSSFRIECTERTCRSPGTDGAAGREEVTVTSHAPFPAFTNVARVAWCRPPDGRCRESDPLDHASPRACSCGLLPVSTHRFVQSSADICRYTPPRSWGARHQSPCARRLRPKRRRRSPSTCRLSRRLSRRSGMQVRGHFRRQHIPVGFMRPGTGIIDPNARRTRNAAAW